LKDYLSGIKHYSLLTQKKYEEVKKKRVELKPLLNRILSQFDASIEEKKLQIVIDQESACDLWSDEVLLEPILFNLVSNAVKYSPNGSKIQIRITTSGKKFVAIHVRDQGCGIPKEHHERIFEKFYRVQDDNSYKVKGNGLGLYLVRYFGEKIGTRISFWSELGVGTQFSLSVEKFKQKEQAHEHFE
jgi:signal transduction histidine kinase